MLEIALTHDAPAAALEAWLLAHAREGDLLLAFADDGVVWGRVDGGRLTTAHAALGDAVAGSGARLRPIALQEARLFGEQREVFVWRTDDGFRARVLDDAGYDVHDEPMLLWGDTVVARGGGFSVLQDGADGMRHAVPVDVAPGTGDAAPAVPPRLVVRHLRVADPETGLARVAASRLVRLDASPTP